MYRLMVITALLQCVKRAPLPLCTFCVFVSSESLHHVVAFLYTGLDSDNMSNPQHRETASQVLSYFITP